MIVNEKNGLKYYQFHNLSEYGICHGLFTRQGGVSPEPYVSLNASSFGGDKDENVVENLRRMFSVFNLDLRMRYDGWMCHSKNVIVAECPRDLRCTPLRSDGLVTDKKGVVLVMRFADCVPVLLYDPEHKAVAIYHAGWRGTVDNMAAVVVEKMRRLYGTVSCDLVAGIGPSIGPDHFVVQEDVAGQFRSAFGARYSEISDLSGGEIRLNLWKSNYLLLEDLGVMNIEMAEICTVCHKDEWFSHRGDHGKTGRFGALITLENA